MVKEFIHNLYTPDVLVRVFLYVPLQSHSVPESIKGFLCVLASHHETSTGGYTRQSLVHLLPVVRPLSQALSVRGRQYL